MIYTSDHGELLGENGLLGNNSPMCPELVHVATVLVHNDLSNAVIESPPFDRIGLLPTILSIIKLKKYSSSFDETSLLDKFSDTPQCSIYYKEFSSSIQLLNRDISESLKYKGVRDSNGKYVFSIEHMFNRLFVLGGQGFISSKRSYLRAHLPPAIRKYMKGDEKYAVLQFIKSQARAIVEGIKNEIGPQNHYELTEKSKAHLEDLAHL